ncbi:hypothetical protein B0T16DRAFT_188850 [Cercophora newfieldiana]|uniref:Uncharacterized protein n=1 Tax=Cercophora newfieldiana TaxID=92897 RepID=A0AA39Y1P9_9PEZI|nr:hypothetical protein B0T16DRAFT_188850 [Cercophora newfieldiana]
MGLLRKLFNRPKKAAAITKTNFVNPNPFPSDESFAAVKAHMQHVAQQNPERYAALMRAAAFQIPMGWLETNFPPPNFEIIVPGPFPCDMPLNVRPGLEGVEPEDTSVYIVKDSQGGIRCVQLVVWMGNPTGGDGEPREWIGTRAMKSAEEGLEELLRKMCGVGRLERCIAVVGMGMDMTIYCFEEGRGFFDPPEGFGFETQRVDWGDVPPPPPVGSK